MQDYVEVKALLDLFGDDAEWRMNVAANDLHGNSNMGLDGENDGTVESFAADEVTAVQATLYYFAGSEGESERFYASDRTVYKSADGRFWVVDDGELFEF